MTKNEMTSKKSLKHVEIPLNHFNEIAIPYYENLLEEHKTTLKEVKNDTSKLRNFQNTIRSTEAKLKGLLYDLDTLRAQVNNDELDKFDMKTVALRKTILNISSQYKDITKQLQTYIPIHENNEEKTKDNRTQAQKQLKITTDVNDLILKERETCLRQVDEIQNDIQDLHSIYGELNQMVHEQGELVDKIETNVEDTQQNVHGGFRHILSAARLKASMYPVGGAVVGGVMGGPIGLLAGLKIGGAAAVCCGCLGYVGGKIITKFTSPKTEELNIENELYNQNETSSSLGDAKDKKDE